MVDLMIYGASGFTGALIAERAQEVAGRADAPVLAGRDPDKVRALAERLPPSTWPPLLTG